MAERAERREKRRLIDARFPQIKRLEDFRFADNPNVPQATIAALAEGSWIDDRESGDLHRRLRAPARRISRPRSRSAPASRAAASASPRSPAWPTSSKRPRAAASSPASSAATPAPSSSSSTSSATSPCPTAPPSSSSKSSPNATNAASLIVTTNLPFGEWTKVFPDPRLAKAVVDRLTHRAHIIDTGTESWRFRHGLTRTTNKRRRPPAA